MRNSQKATFAEVFEIYISAVTARGVKDKTIATYKQHFHAISKRLDVSLPINRLNSTALDNMILQMRKEGLSDSSINSYTRTLKCFLSWCNEEGYTKANLKIYKAAETVKETYTDEELLTLLAKPDADCKFCEYRNWVIVNFLLNSGCRAATVRNIQNQDVDLSRRQIVLRHTKNGKVQVIPLCSAMVSILRDYMAVREGESSDYLFCNEFGGFLTENALRLAIVKYNNSRGVERTSIHAFRHTFARKYLVDCGGDAFSLQQIMGHSTLKMTRHYCNLFNDDIIENHEQHSPLAQLTRSKRQTIRHCHFWRGRDQLIVIIHSRMRRKVPKIIDMFNHCVGLIGKKLSSFPNRLNQVPFPRRVAFLFSFFVYILQYFLCFLIVVNITQFFEF